MTSSQCAFGMYSGCIEQQVKHSKREQEQPRQGTNGTGAGKARAEQHEVPDSGVVSTIQPEVIAILIEDENLGGQAKRQHPLPFCHDGLGGAYDAQNAIAVAGEFAVKARTALAATIIGDAVDTRGGGIEPARDRKS